VVTASDVDSIKQNFVAAGFSLQEFPHPLNARMRGSDLRIQLMTDPRYQEFLSATTPMDVLGVTAPVATIENIVRGKIWAWSDEERRPTKRKKDELDLMRILEAYPELRDQMPPAIQKQVPKV
jgi:hypothetical protein